MATVRMEPIQSKADPVNVLYAKRALTNQEASLYIGMSQSWLRHMRIKGACLNNLAGPCFIKVGRSVRYLREDLDTWLEHFQRCEHLAQHYNQELSKLMVIQP